MSENHPYVREFKNLKARKIPVATLQGHLWSKLCSKFHENRGILKLNITQKGLYFDTVFWAFLRSVSYQLFSKKPVIEQYTMMLESVFEIVQTDKLSMYYELVNIYKYGEKSSFKHFSCFLKNRGILKGFDYFSWFRKKRLGLKS